MGDEITYETRAIAFLDILGWRAAVQSSVDDSELRRRLHNAVWALGALATNDAEDDTPQETSRDRVSQISDTIIISIPFAQPFDLLRLIRQVASYQSAMLLSGFLLRGGITVGPLYHEGSLVFGPALNAAYELEVMHAVTPRVLIDKSLNGQVSEAGARLPKHWPFVSTDSDGYIFPDYLTMYAKSPSASERIEKLIASGLNSSSDTSILGKYRWLSEKWVQVRDVVRE